MYPYGKIKEPSGDGFRFFVELVGHLLVVSGLILFFGWILATKYGYSEVIVQWITGAVSDLGFSLESFNANWITNHFLKISGFLLLAGLLFVLLSIPTQTTEFSRLGDYFSDDAIPVDSIDVVVRMKTKTGITKDTPVTFSINVKDRKVRVSTFDKGTFLEEDIKDGDVLSQRTFCALGERVIKAAHQKLNPDSKEA